MSFLKPWTLPKHIILSVLITTIAYWISRYVFPRHQASSIGIIGGADGPTVVYVSGKLLSHNLVYIAVFILLLVLYLPVSRWLK